MSNRYRVHLTSEILQNLLSSEMQFECHLIDSANVPDCSPAVRYFPTGCNAVGHKQSQVSEPVLTIRKTHGVTAAKG